MNNVAYVDGDPIVLPTVIYDVARCPIKVDEMRWSLNSATASRSINWMRLDGCDPGAVLALKLEIIGLIEKRSPQYAHATFANVSDYLLAAKERAQDPHAFASLMQQLERLRKDGVAYKFHHIRMWYRNSADRLVEDFDFETCFALDELRIEGNKKGVAVLSDDPECGPLSQFESIALTTALQCDRGLLEQRVATWLELAFGTNPANIALLREEDYIELVFPNGLPNDCFLDIPRIKKRTLPRSEFKRRALDPKLAILIAELIAQNRRRNKSDEIRPLFRRSSPRDALASGPLQEYQFHYTAGEITSLVSDCVARLNVKSPRTGESLKVNSRRLRYTFACKMVREGTKAIELAQLLDHTDTQNVLVYYTTGLIFVERLDVTIAEQIAPKVHAFLGTLTDCSTKTVDLIPFHDLPALGICGASFICALAPHRSCYGCEELQAAVDGPHEEVRRELILERDELISAGNERAAEQLTRPVLAVTEVILKIKALADAP